MTLVSLKTVLPWLVPGSAAVLLCVWALASRQPARVTDKKFNLHPPIDAVTSVAPLMPAGGSLHDESASSTNARSPRSTIDEALGRLERELRLATQIADADERRGMLAGACLSWADFDPADALRMARALGLDQTPNAVIEDIVQKWAKTDFPAALAWTNRESIGEPRDRLLARLVFVRSQTQPDEAVTLAIARISPGPAQAEAIISVIHQWALRDFDGARAWVSRLPVDLRDRAQMELAGIASYRLTLSEASN